jgi:hypothetical protein
VALELWGDVEVPFWMDTRFAVLPDWTGASFNACWELRFERHVRHLHRAWGRAEPTLIPLPARRILFEVSLPLELLVGFGTDFTTLALTFRQGVLARASKAYIMDPRSGSSFVGGALPCPSSPLLDPPPPPSGQVRLSCCFCSENSEDDDYVWANGTLLWVHHRCWPLIFGLPSLPSTSGSFWFTTSHGGTPVSELLVKDGTDL